MKLMTGALLGASLAVSGCAAGPDYREPKVAMPGSFISSTQPATRPAVQVDAARWWRSLGDPELDALVDRAAESNLDVQIALARLQESRASEYAISGGVLPYLEGSAAAARGSGNNSVKGRIPGPLNAATNTQGLHEITEVMGFDAGWEIDLFGRFRRQLEAAAADVQAAGEARNGVLITVISEVARTYIELRATQARLAIAQQNVDVSQQTLTLVTQRFDRGLTNELDVALARRQTAEQRAALAPLQDQVTRDRRRLAVLLGMSPEGLQEELARTGPLPMPPESLITGLPVDLLRRRPDIREAERRLAAENARIGAATAELFPRIALTAGFGFQGQGLGRQPTTESMIWSVGPTVVMPLLDFGRIDSMIMLEDLRTRELYQHYRQTILRAVEEVDDSVAGYDAQRDRLAQLNEAVAASRRAVELATGRYERGLIDFLNVLDAQRQLFALQDQATVAQQAVAVEYIAVYKALGGGWENWQRVPDLRKPLPAVLAAGAQLARVPQKTLVAEPAAPPATRP